MSDRDEPIPTTQPEIQWGPLFAPMMTAAAPQPRTVTTLAEMDDLPDGSVIVGTDKWQTAYQKITGGWAEAGEEWGPTAEKIVASGPLLVVFTPAK